MTNIKLSLKKTTNEVVEKRDRSISKGIIVAMSCEILKINEETYRIQSETAVDRYYIVRFSGGEPTYCTCKNFEIASQRNADHVCKHMRSIIYASVNNLILVNEPIKTRIPTTTIPTKSFKEDEYSW